MCLVSPLLEHLRGSVRATCSAAGLQPDVAEATKVLLRSVASDKVIGFLVICRHGSKGGKFVTIECSAHHTNPAG